MFVGSACAAKAAKLQKGARIKLGDVDVTTRYDAEKKETYTNYKVFSFEDPDADNEQPGDSGEKVVDSGESDAGGKKLPF